jgi:hypothetical protein
MSGNRHWTLKKDNTYSVPLTTKFDGGKRFRALYTQEKEMEAKDNTCRKEGENPWVVTAMNRLNLFRKNIKKSINFQIYQIGIFLPEFQHIFPQFLQTGFKVSVNNFQPYTSVALNLI